MSIDNAVITELEKKIAEQTAQIRLREEELSVINSVQEALAHKMDIQSIYELVGEKMREIFKAQVIDIATYDPKTKLIEDRYSYEKGDRSILGPREAKGFRKHIIETGEMLMHNENIEEACREYQNEVLIGEMPKSQVFFPLSANGKVVGVISLQNLDHEHAFTDADISLLTTLANSMSVALENARLFDETTHLLKVTEQRNAELAVINSVQEGLAKELDIQAIYELVGEKMREIFNAQVIDIVTYDPQNDLIEDKYAYEKGDRTILGPREPKGFRKHVIENAKTLAINNNLDQERIKYDQAVIIGEGAKSLVLVPMIAGGEVTGVISLQNLDQEDAFPESNVNLLTTLANSMSVALESAKLFDKTTHLLKETEQRTAELAVINSVQEGLSRELDIQAIYELVGEKMREIFNAQVIDIVTYDPQTNLIEDQYAYEKGDRTMLGPREAKGFRKHVIKTGKILLHNANVDKAIREFNNEVLIGETPKSQVYAPMIAGGQVKGIISLQNLDQENAFSDSDISLLSTLVNSMTVALQNARLFDETSLLLKETEQRTAELAVINSVQEGLAHELDIQAIYDLVGDRIRELFNAQAVIIANLDTEKGLEIFKYVIENKKRFYLESRPLDKLRQHLIKTKQKIVINKNFEEAFANFGMKVA
ncbi:MAG: GAF domain-containing protein, partial [Chitinophagaceae bacterium]